MFLLMGKVLFITILATIFLIHFGLPSYLKYKENETLISETKVNINWNKPPAVTVIAWRQQSEKGWKEESDSDKEYLGKNCNISQEFQELTECINSKTFNLSEMLEKATSEDHTTKDLTNNSFWTEDFSNFDLGKSFSLNHSYEIEKDSPYLGLFFKESLNYTILIHDPNYFIYTNNPDTVPQVRLSMDDSKAQLVYIKAVYHQMMDKPEHRCESTESYSFTACIKNSLSTMIGCRLEWDGWSSRDIPVCKNTTELLEFEKEYEKIDTWEQDSIVNLTGCFPPCSYTEYKLAAKPHKFKTGKELRLQLSSSKVLMRREKIIYSMESLVSEFGGALGLFLGFSFMMLWNILAYSTEYCMNSISLNNLKVL